MENHSPSLTNADLAPVPPDQRTWKAVHFASLWVGMAVCIPTYTLAAGLISQGMNWWQALGTILLGNLIVLVPILLNAHAGTRYGIPFPVLLRSSFGTVGANIPALMRAIVACGWFGIQTWIGGEAIFELITGLVDLPPAITEHKIAGLGLTPGQLVCFLFFWAIHMAIILWGMDAVRRFEVWAAPLLLIGGLVLLTWAVRASGGLSHIFANTTLVPEAGSENGPSIWKVFWPNLTAMVGFWATLSLNIPDFTRFARSQKAQVWGQVIALPASMVLVSFIGIAVSSATATVFGEVIWDPVKLLGRFESPIVVSLALLAIVLATLSTNLAANVVSPANDFSNVKPSAISFRRGAIITGIIGILILPWRLYTDLGQYIFTWLIGYGGLLGAIAGVMLVDYYLVRKGNLVVDELYQKEGRYAGINIRAMISL
ncbi:MAG: NCS1 family nucleobase:cation symporter-1, partial [Verrucomicrobiota bacterium]